MSNLLKNSLMDMYKNDFYVLELLEQCNLETLENNYLRELYARMSKEEVLAAQEIVTCDLVKRYDLAATGAVLALTRQISELLDLVLTPQGDNRLN